jgi:GAF domain-containing protein
MTSTGKLRDIEGRQQQLLRLVELSVTLNSTLDLDDLLQIIIETATELLDCEGASILLYDEKNHASILPHPQARTLQNWPKSRFLLKAVWPALYSVRVTISS